MNAILSMVKNGRVEVDAPPDWPEGSPVRVELGLNGKATDDERPETPEEIEEWIRRFREIEPVEMTPEEEAAWEADRKAQKEFEIANAAERNLRIDEIFPMRRYLLDTGIMGDLISRRLGVAQKVEEARRRGDRVGTCWPVAGELWFGLEGSASRERNLQRLIRTLNEMPKWPFEDEAAQHYGRLHHELRRVGRVMSVVDMQLAAIAFALGNCTVVTKDGDLSAVPGLKVENWATV